ncbi:MAG: hypothetical protein ACO3NB_09410 [Ilumatobacteraceae bacterium]
MSCTIDDCDKAHYARGWCIVHWRHHRARQTVEWQTTGPQPIHGTRRRYAKGCRCSDCSRRESEYRAAWRLATGRTTTSTVLGGPS